MVLDRGGARASARPLCGAVPAFASAIVLIGLVGIHAASAQAPPTWTFSTRAGIAWPANDAEDLGGGMFDQVPTFEAGAGRSLGGPFWVLVSGTFISERGGFGGVPELHGYTRASVLPVSIALRVQRAAPTPDGLAAGLELGPAVTCWHESQHYWFDDEYPRQVHDGSYTAWVPAVRGAGRIVTPAVVGCLALELGVTYLRVAGVRHPADGFNSAWRAVDGLSLFTVSAGLALRP